MKKFEKAFAIDRIEELVTKIVKGRQGLQFKPSENQFHFTSDIYVDYKDAIDDFKTRHSTIRSEIDTSNKIGLKLEDFL